MSVLAQDYPSAPANPSSLAKRDARGLNDGGEKAVNPLLKQSVVSLIFFSKWCKIYIKCAIK